MASTKVEMVGEGFGLLTVLARAGSQRTAGGRLKSLWLCRCRCGVEVLATRQSLVDGKRRYCSWTAHREVHLAVIQAGMPPLGLPRLYPVTHGSWRHMHRRCEPGGKYEKFGVEVCSRWADFATFLADMGERPSAAHTIDRIDTRGNYEPGNCRWATDREQRENKRTTRWVEWRGERRKLVEVCREERVRLSLVGGRLLQGWPIERAVSQLPVLRGTRARIVAQPTLSSPPC